MHKPLLAFQLFTSSSSSSSCVPMSSSSKRSKIVRSSSQGHEIGLFSHVQPIEPQWVPKRSDYWERFQESTAAKPNVEKPTMTGYRGKQKAERSRGKSILTINSPPPEKSNGSDKFRGFLKQCAWCKKDLNADVFMYGYVSYLALSFLKFIIIIK